MVYKAKKVKKQPFPFRLPFKINSIFLKVFLFTLIAVTGVVTLSFLTKKGGSAKQTLPAQANFLDYDLSNKNKQDVDEILHKINKQLQELSVEFDFAGARLIIDAGKYNFHFDENDFFKKAQQTKFDEGQMMSPAIKYDKGKLKKDMENFSKTHQILPEKCSYKRVGNILRVSAGSDGKIFDVEKNMEKVVKAFRELRGGDLESIFTVKKGQDKRINFKKIKADVECEPSDACFEGGRFKKERDGLTIVDGQENKITNPDEGSYDLKLVVTKPKVTTSSLKQNVLRSKTYQKELASFSTRVKRLKTKDDEARRQNIGMAARAVDGIVLFPGEEFSFGAAIAEDIRRNKTAYGKAICFDPSEKTGKTLAVGGGICQVCSTVHGAALRANLNITERHPHTYKVQYVPIGQDAAYSSGGKNLKFVNNRKSPIIVKANYSGDSVTCRILGNVNEEKFDVVISSRETSPPGASKITATATVTVKNHPASSRSFHSQYSVMPKDKNGRAVEVAEAAPITASPQPAESTNQQQGVSSVPSTAHSQTNSVDSEKPRNNASSAATVQTSPDSNIKSSGGAANLKTGSGNGGENSELVVSSGTKNAIGGVSNSAVDQKESAKQSDQSSKSKKTNSLNLTASDKSASGSMDTASTNKQQVSGSGSAKPANGVDVKSSSKSSTEGGLVSKTVSNGNGSGVAANSAPVTT